MSLKKNIKWVAASQFFKIFTQLISIFYLTNLILPSEYGLLAMSAVVINLANIFNDLGTGAAIIQKQNITLNFYNFIYKINIITGFVVMIIVIGVTPLLVHYFRQEKLYSVLLLLSFSFPIIASSIVHKSNFEKLQLFNILAKIEILSSLIGLFVAIFLANLNYGVYSLVAQILLSSFLFSFLVIYFSELKLSLWSKVNKEELRGVLGFSGNLFLFNLINYFTRNLDSILIGRFFSTSILGAYSLAYRIMLFPVQSLTSVISRAFLPHITKDLSNIEKNKTDYLKCLFMILSICSPLMIGLLAVSKDFVNIFFNSKWSLISDLLIWLAPTAIVQAVLSTTGTIFIAYARTFWLFLLGVIGAILTAIAFIGGIFRDIQTLTFYYFIANLINFIPVMLLLKKILNFSYFDIMSILFKTLIPALIMWLVICFFNYYFYIDDLIYRFILEVLVGIITYILLYSLMNKSIVFPLLRILKVRL